MARKERSRAGVNARGTITYFFLNGKLHKRLLVNRGSDTIETWCYPLGKRVAYTYSDVKAKYQPAYTTEEVSRMLGRHRVHLERCIIAGNLAEPQYTYGLNEHRRKYKYMWDEQLIMDALAFFATQHAGKPRKDGRTTPKHLPTPRELRAMIRQENVLYVKNENGEFVPSWRAQDFT